MRSLSRAQRRTPGTKRTGEDLYDLAARGDRWVRCTWTETDRELFELVPVLEEQAPIGGQATAYVCRNYQCSAPTTDIEEALRLVG